MPAGHSSRRSRAKPDTKVGVGSGSGRACAKLAADVTANSRNNILSLMMQIALFTGMAQAIELNGEQGKSVGSPPRSALAELRWGMLLIQPSQ